MFHYAAFIIDERSETECFTPGLTRMGRIANREDPDQTASSEAV